MSQAKVDRYKKEKANRKKNMKKEKIQNVLRKCAVFVVALVLVGWIGYSAYNTYESKKPKEELHRIKPHAPLLVRAPEIGRASCRERV